MNLEERLLSSSFQMKNFQEMQNVTSDSIVVIVNACHPVISIYNVDGLNEEEIKSLVETHLRELTIGCNYTYSIIQSIGNCYFCN